MGNLYKNHMYVTTTTIIIIIFLHGLGRLTCSGIDALHIFSWGVHDLLSLEVCS
jgi:hypothetical protein